MHPDEQPARDARHLRGVADALQGVRDAEQELRDAVAAARQAGHSWATIGMVLGTSRQAAFQRFAASSSQRKGASTTIRVIETIGEAAAERLRAAGIRTTEELLDRARSRQGRRRLASETGVDEKQILRWVNLADLMRIKGVSSQYSELLEAAGVNTVKELQTRNATNLAAKLAEVSETFDRVERPPAAKTVANWVAMARELAQA